MIGFSIPRKFYPRNGPSYWSAWKFPAIQYSCCLPLRFLVSSAYASAWGFSDVGELHLRPVHNTTLNNALRCVVFSWTFVETQHDARIYLNPILTFPCIAFLHLVIKKLPTFLIINLCVSRINAMQGLVSLHEPAFRVNTQSSLMIFTVSIA